MAKCVYNFYSWPTDHKHCDERVEFDSEVAAQKHADGLAEIWGCDVAMRCPSSREIVYIADITTEP